MTIAPLALAGRWNCVDASGLIVSDRCSIVDRTLPIVDRSPKSLTIVCELQKSLTVTAQKIGRQISGARPGGLQQISLEGLSASHPVTLAGKPGWLTCWQITRPALLARCV